MERFSPEKAIFLSLICFLCQSLDLGDCLNDEGRALLRFRERVVVDPFGALSNWVEGEDDPCSWFGVGCSDDGRRVVALNLKDLLLEGTIAPAVGKLFHLKTLILHNNSFYGTIPKEIGELRKLKVLDLGRNNLSGPFPSDIGSVLSLEVLVLRNNRNIGNIPPELHDLSIFSESWLDEEQSSSNSFAITRKTENAAIRRLLQEVGINKGDRHGRESHLTPAPAPSPATSPLQPPPIFHSVPRKEHSTHLKVFLWAVAGFVFFILLSVMYYLCCRANKIVTVMPWRTGLSRQLQRAFVTGVPSLGRSELESACEDFSNVVGSLSDCYLYKGTLSDGVEIAVTSTMISSAKDWSYHCEAQFRKKISVLSKVNHKNFMNLIGYCEEDEPFTRMMVYEYAPNGTLFEHLHIKEADHLDWAARLKIIMGIAYCLDHMHQLDPPVVLKNLSSSSIYLFDDYAAKISDLSFWNEEKEEDQSLESSGVMDVQLSTLEGNVYKFGTLLLETISGRLPFSEDDGLLVLWASSHLMGKRPLMDMVDKTLEWYSNEDVTALCDVIKACVKPDPRRRPAMSQVVAQLRQITGISPSGATPKLSPLWWAELEIISTECNSLL